MILQVQNLLVDTLGLIGVTEIDETPEASDLQVTLRTLNIMLDRWASRRLMVRGTTDCIFNTVAGQVEYTIGDTTPPSDIPQVKPLSIMNAVYRDSSGNDFPLDIFTEMQYDNLSDKIISQGPPMYLMYDTGLTQQTQQIGTISIYPKPDSVYQIRARVVSYFTSFSNLTDVITFEPLYYEAIIYNLALRIFRRYHTNPATQIPQDIVQIAKSSINDLNTANSVQYVSAIDLPGRPSSYNIYSDQQQP